VTLVDKHVFISHSSSDRRVARRLCSRLEKAEIPCWIAPRNIVPPEPYPEAIIRAIKQSFAFVLVLSASSNVSPQVAYEVERAGARRTRMFTLRIEDVRPSESLELFVSTGQWIDAPARSRRQGYGELVRAVGACWKEVGQAPEEPPPTGIQTVMSALGRAWDRIADFLQAYSLPVGLITLFLVVGLAVDRTWFRPLRPIAPGLGLYLVKAQSDASVDSYLGTRSALGRTFRLHRYDPLSGATTIEGDAKALVPVQRTQSLRYVAVLPRGEGSWTSLYMWSKSQLLHFKGLSASSGNATHLVLVLNSRRKDRLRVGLKDYTGREAKVTLEISPGWNVYAIPLAAFARVDPHAILLIQLGYEDSFALQDHLEMEVLDVSFRRLSLAASR